MSAYTLIFCIGIFTGCVIGHLLTVAKKGWDAK